MPGLIPTPFNVLNVLVMLEAEPLTDKYLQIELTKEQHQQVLDLLESFMLATNDGFLVEVTDDEPVAIVNRRSFVDS